MKCRYEYEVRAQCPVNPADTDLYQFAIESEGLIEVERNMLIRLTHTAPSCRVFVIGQPRPLMGE